MRSSKMLPVGPDELTPRMAAMFVVWNPTTHEHYLEWPAAKGFQFIADLIAEHGERAEAEFLAAMERWKGKV